MKKFLIGLVVIVAFFATTAFGAERTTTWGWTDDNVTGTVVSWDIFRGASATGPWTLVTNQVFYDKGVATEYRTTAAVTVADNAETTVFFKAQTLGTNGLRSTDSNIISVLYDTRTAPVAPGNFNVK